jgi:hypothetical protein
MLSHFLRAATPKSNAITFIQSANTQATVANNANLTLTLSTAPSQNDLIIVVFSNTGITNNLVTTTTPPTGFTEAGANSGDDIYVAYKVAGASEGTSYAFTNTSGSSQSYSAYIVVYRNAVWDTIGAVGTGTTVTTPAITIAANNSLLFIYGRGTGASCNFTTPSTFTDLYEDGDATAPSIYVGTKSVNSGSTGTVSFTSSTGNNLRALLFAIKPT